MKDRQPTQVLANGAIRYGIYGVDGTLDRYEYMKREDEPTIEGTPLNKANLLSDVTENKIWNNKEKPTDPTVNDALYELSKGTARIGDISMTARGDRSASWLPCDGRAISNVTYPDLYNVLRTDVDAGDWDEIEVTGMIGTHPSISYANGHWFIVAKSGNNYSLKVATSDNLETFTVANISNVGTTQKRWSDAAKCATTMANMYLPITQQADRTGFALSMQRPRTGRGRLLQMSP